MQNSCTIKRLTRRCPSPEVTSGWPGLLLRVAALPVCAALAVGACATDSGVQQAPPDALEVPVPRGLENVAHLRRAQSALDNRPASCTTTRAIVISDGTPNPRRLRVGSGACLIWGNMSGGPVRVSYARALGGRPQGPADGFEFPARSARGMGPYVTLTPWSFAQMLADERGKFGCTTLREDSHYGARYYTAAKRGVTIPYALEPGGATGEIIIEPSQHRAAKLPAQVREVRRLRCGRHAVDGRPPHCKTPRALLIVNGEPVPAMLTIRRRQDCVVWGNKGKRPLRIESESCPRCFFSLFVPGGSAHVTEFRGAAPQRFPHLIRYTVRPGSWSEPAGSPSRKMPRRGRSGTILLQDR